MIGISGCQERDILIKRERFYVRLLVKYCFFHCGMLIVHKIRIFGIILKFFYLCVSTNLSPYENHERNMGPDPGRK